MCSSLSPTIAAVDRLPLYGMGETFFTGESLHKAISNVDSMTQGMRIRSELHNEMCNLKCLPHAPEYASDRNAITQKYAFARNRGMDAVGGWPPRKPCRARGGTSRLCIGCTRWSCVCGWDRWSYFCVSQIVLCAIERAIVIEVIITWNAENWSESIKEFPIAKGALTREWRQDLAADRIWLPIRR